MKLNLASVALMAAAFGTPTAPGVRVRYESSGGIQGVAQSPVDTGGHGKKRRNRAYRVKARARMAGRLRR